MVRLQSGESRQIEGFGFTHSRQEFYFLAPTAEQAKSLAEAFLVIYDQGYALPARRAAAKWKQAALRKPAARQEDLEKAKQALADIAAKRDANKSADSLSDESVAELTKKRLLLKVEQVGVTARAAALEAKIAERRKAGNVPESIIALKEAADIDLAGLTGQLGEIDRLIGTTAKLQQIRREYDRVQYMVSGIEAQLSLDKLELEVYEDDYRTTAPYELADEAIPVQPIAWTSPNK
jgi:hypothetical protein